MCFPAYHLLLKSQPIFFPPLSCQLKMLAIISVYAFIMSIQMLIDGKETTLTCIFSLQASMMKLKLHY